MLTTHYTTNKNFITFTVILFALTIFISILYTPNSAYATDRNFSDFQNLYRSGEIWESAKGYLEGNHNGIRSIIGNNWGNSNAFGVATGTTEATEVLNPNTGQYETKNMHMITISQPSANGNFTGESDFVICADDFYHKYVGNDSLYNGFEFKIADTWNWSFNDTNPDTGYEREGITYTARWNYDMANDRMQCIPLTTTFVIKDSWYQYGYLTEEEIFREDKYTSNGGDANYWYGNKFNKDNSTSSCWRVSKKDCQVRIINNTEVKLYKVETNMYFGFLICGDTNLNPDQKDPNHGYYNQWFLAMVPEIEMDTITSIKSVRGSDNSNDNFTDNRSDEDIFKNPKTEGDYSHTTAPEALNDSKTIEAKLINVNKSVWMGSAGAFGYAVYTEAPKYSSYNAGTITKDISYTTKLPTIKQTKFTPYTLNRNNISQSGDGGIVDSEFFKNTIPLACKINNKRKDSNDSKASADEKPNANNLAIQSLDTNADNQFTFSFLTNEGVYGLPNNINGKNYNWNNTPKELANKTYEMANHKSYANGRVSSDPDGCFRYNVNFLASTMVKGSNTNQEISSLLLNGENELTDKDLFSKKYNDDKTFSGGDWSTRFISIGDYETSSNNNRD